MCCPTLYGSRRTVKLARALVCATSGETGRIVVEQHGMIKIIDLATNTVLPTPFLDLNDTVGQGQGPGLLGMTFTFLLS